MQKIRLSCLAIRTKMLGALMIILIPYFVYTNYNNYAITRKMVRHDIVTRILPLTSDNIYSEVQSDLIRPVFVSSLMSNDTFLKDWVLAGERDIAGISRYLSTIKNKYSFFSSFFVSRKSGRYYYYNGVLKKISRSNSHDQWYYRFIEKNVPYVIDVDTDEATRGTLTIFINHRLNDYSGRLLGVTGVGLKMLDVTNRLRVYRDKFGCNVYFVNSNGIVQAHSDIKMINSMNIRTVPGVSEAASGILKKGEGQKSFRVSRDGHEIHLISRYIPRIRMVSHRRTG